MGGKVIKAQTIPSKRKLGSERQGKRHLSSHHQRIELMRTREGRTRKGFAPVLFKLKTPKRKKCQKGKEKTRKKEKK